MTDKPEQRWYWVWTYGTDVYFEKAESEQDAIDKYTKKRWGWKEFELNTTIHCIADEATTSKKVVLEDA